jgi:uncharacterized protein with NRDE domain
MCLLIALSRCHPDAPLIVAANRDEVLARPAIPMARLGDDVRGGVDELAGGTWLAVHRRGVVAALTNVPGPRDAARRSRGRLPLDAVEAGGGAAGGAAALSALDARAFNPCWMFVGDATALYFVDMAAPDDAGRAPVVSLPPGLHVLENRRYGAPSPKVDHVRAALADVTALRGDALLRRLADLLADHTVPDQAGREVRETEACCVHATLPFGDGLPYGTRSATLTFIDGRGPPRVRFTEGAPCRHAFVDAPAW